MRKPTGKRIKVSPDFIWALVGYKAYSDEVVRMHNNKARLKIISAPARTSKSWSGAFDALPDCFHDLLETPEGKIYPFPGEKRIWIVAPTYQLAKEFDYLKQILVDQQKKLGLTFYSVERCQTNADQGQMRLVLNFGNSWDDTPVRTHIEVKSATNMQSIQADEADVVIMSEAADQEEIVWDKYISTRYTRAILPTTPKIKAEWLRKLIELGKQREELGIATFWYDGRCNPTYDWDRYWIEHAKAESRQSCPPRRQVDFAKLDRESPPSKDNGHDCFDSPWDCYAAKDPHFAEQYMGRWTQAEGRVLPFRAEATANLLSHVVQELPSWVATGRHYLSMDYGFDDPTAVGWFAVSTDGTVILYDLLYESGLTPADVARRVADRQKDHAYFKREFNFPRAPKLAMVAGDPQNPAVRAEFRRVGLPVQVVDKARQRDRAAGFNVFRDYLSDDPLIGRPRFFVYGPKCQAAVDEFRLLMRKPNSKDEHQTAGKDHAVDMTRYLLTILPRGHTYIPEVDDDVRQQIWLNQRRMAAGGTIMAGKL